MMFRPLLLALLLLAFPSLAQAQGTTGVASQIEKVAEAARSEGMTVIVMSPAAPTAQPAAMQGMRAARFLAARARLREILASAGTLLPAMGETLERMSAASLATSPFGDWRWGWLVRGLLTAAFGAFVGWLALRPIVRRSGRGAARRRERWEEQGYVPDTSADRARVLLIKTGYAAFFAAVIWAVALLVAVILDSDFEPTRRVIFECLTAFLIYRLLRFAFSWPLTAYDDPAHRMTGLGDAEARSMYRGFSLWVAIVLVPMVGLRFFIAEGPAAAHGGSAYGALTPEHVALLTLAAAFLGTVAVVAFALIHRRETVQVLMPREDATAHRLAVSLRVQRALARALPLLIGVYGVASLLAFLYRLGLGLSAPSAVVLAPFVIFYTAFVAYCVVLVAIRFFYDVRERRYLARMEAERERLRAEEDRARARLDAGEEMTIGRAPEADLDAPIEFRPIMRGFLERAALAIVVTVALGELGRWWGVPVGTEGNAWAGFLDIVLAVALAWIAYGAITAAIDRRLAEETGPEVDEDALGNEGGAGASRLATLLPILRWVLVAIVVIAAVIAILSRFGVDIGPLLASAGVVGIAVGFGAQKLIQDIFSGAFFLLDDAFRRGEYIDVEGTKGTVEKISIRSFQLRHHLGALHTLPFGEIRKLTNFSRDWVLMKLPLRVTYDTDVEKVRKLIKKLGQQLLEHPEVGHTFMQPLKSQGVYRMEDSAMIIRVKFMTKPGEQFVTRKVVYAAIRDLFERENIRFAHKEVTVRLAEGEGEHLSEEQRKAVTAAAREVIDAEAAEEAVAAGAGR